MKSSRSSLRHQVAVLLGQVERVAQGLAARHDRDLVHLRDRGQQLRHQRVAGLVVGDDRASRAGVITRRVCSPATTRSKALSKSAWTIRSRPSRPAKIAASLQRFARSAPVSPDGAARDHGEVHVLHGHLAAVHLQDLLAALRGRAARPAPGGRSGRAAAARGRGRRSGWMRRSRSRRGGPRSRPSRPAAGSGSGPSRGRCRSPRLRPTASISSMKMIAGAWFFAISNSRRIRAAPRPANISTNELADWLKKCAPDSLATALASSVLPVPGGPCSRMPRGTLAPSLLKRSGSRRNSTTSRSSCFASSQPATSSHADTTGGLGLELLRLVPRHHLEAAPDQVHERAHQDDGHPGEKPGLQLVHERHPCCCERKHPCSNPSCTRERGAIATKKAAGEVRLGSQPKGDLAGIARKFV